MKKRLLSLFTSLIMVISLVGILPVMTVGAETSFGNVKEEKIDLNEIKSITIKENDKKVYFTFTPEESGMYYFYSTGDIDTYGSITSDYYYDVEDDDSGIELNFKITCNLKANITYELMCSSYNAGSFKITVNKATIIDNGNLNLDETKSLTMDNEDDIVFFSFTSKQKGKCYFYSTGEYDTVGYVFDENMDELYNQKNNSENGNFEIVCYFEAGKTYHLACKLIDNYEYYEEDIKSFNISLSTKNHNNEGAKYNYTNEGKISLNEEKEISINYTKDDSYNCHYFEFTPEKSGTYYFTSSGGSDTVGSIFNKDMLLLAEDDDNGSQEGDFFISYYFTANVTYRLCCRSFYTNHEFNTWLYVSDSIFQYSKLEDGTIRIDGYNGPCGNVEIPLTINGCFVTSIGDGAFEYCSSLTSITIPDSVTSIGDEAFAGCTGLTNIEFPDSLTYIGRVAFGDCENLSDVIFNQNLKSIESFAFNNCPSLKVIEVPKSVTKIGDCAFRGCNNIEHIKVNSSNSYYDSRNDCNAIIETASNTLISGCKNTVIPDTVKVIGESAFSWCETLESIVIPSSVTTIEDSAFFACHGLKDITFNEGIKSIGKWAFAYCYWLSSVSVPKSITSIGNDAFFWNFSLESLTILNPDCIIAPLGHVSDNKVTIYGYTNSTAQKFANENNYQYNFVSLGDTKPTTVNGFKVSSTSASAVKLTWNKVSGANGYIIYKYDTAKKTWVRVTKTTTNSNTYTVSGLTQGTTYKFAIKAYKTVNGKEVTSASYPQLTATTNPATVSGFKASSTSASAVKLTWNKVSGANGYIVYKYDTATKTWVRVVKTTTNSNTYTVSKLSAGTTYKFAIKAYKTVSGKEIASASYPQLNTSTNPATVKFTVTAGSKKATVKWSKVTGATGYKVYYKTSKNGKWVGLKSTNNKTTSYTKTGLKKGKKYYFTVKAYRKVNGTTYNGSLTTKSVIPKA